MVVQEFEANEIVSRDGVNSRIVDINSMVPLVIYDNPSGTNHNIDFGTRLAELGINNLNEFEYLEFYYSNHSEDSGSSLKDDGIFCAKIYKWEENGTRFNNIINLELNSGTLSGSNFKYYIVSTRYSIGTTEANKNKAIRDTNKSFTLSYNSSTGAWSSSNSASLYIFRVVGYKH